MCQSKSSEPRSQRSGVNVNQDDEAASNALIHLNLSRQFMEEVDNLTSQLLDNVIRDVIDSGELTGPLNTEMPPESSVSLTSVTPGSVPLLDPNVPSTRMNESREVSTQDATDFVEQLIDQVADPVETERLRISAEDFLGRLIDEVSQEQIKSEEKVAESSQQNAEKTNQIVNSSLSVEASLHDNTGACDDKDSHLPLPVSLVDDLKQSEEPKFEVSLAPIGLPSSKKNAISFFVPASGGLTDSFEKPKLTKKIVKKKPPGLFEQPQFEGLCDEFLHELINETLTLFNPLFQFYRAHFDGSNVHITSKLLQSLPYSQLADQPDLLYKSLTSSKNQNVDAKITRPTIAVQAVSDVDVILERKVFDVKRWACISRPQYRYSCGISALVSCFNLLFSTLGHGDLAPVTHEAALQILGFESPFNEIRFGPFTGNATLKKWFKRLTVHYNVKGSFYTLYKPKGISRTSVSESEALKQLQEGLSSNDTAFIYHCYNHYMCPIGYETTPAFPELAYASLERCQANEQFPPRHWIIFSDTSQTSSSLHSLKWDDIVRDLNCESPFHFNARKPHLGVFRGAQKNAAANFDNFNSDLDEDECHSITLSAPNSEASSSAKNTKKGKNLHCIMAMKRLEYQKLTEKDEADDKLSSTNLPEVSESFISSD